MEASRPGANAPNELPSGRRDSLDQFMPVVYDHLRLVARRHLEMRPGGGTLSTTGLVHEAYLKLVAASPALGMTTRTVQRDWAKARMLLRRALSE